MKSILKLFYFTFLLLILVQCKNEKGVEIEISAKPDSTSVAVIENKKQTYTVTEEVVKGAWFETNVPNGFEAQPSVSSSTSVEGFDSYFFTSPDEEVQFYIYSPQWTGSPNDIVFPNEKITVETVHNNDGSVTRRWTLKPNRQTPYYRSFAETKSENNVLITGFFYKNEAAKAKYKADYDKFTQSVIQYSD